jgi:pyruvate,water dikinase
LSGGKGSNLALLTQRGFPVPPGFVVTAEAYRAFIAGYHPVVSRLAALAERDTGSNGDSVASLRRMLESLPLPEALVHEVHAALGEASPTQAYAVRSSSTMEDQAGAAFAGQHDTFLNITGEAMVLDCIRRCFVSLWNDHAIAYRRRLGAGSDSVAMAVVVQQLIPCEVAGVGFSINPVSGDIGELVINANHGLGESVVSGATEVDQFEVDKKTRVVRRMRVAAKSHKVVPMPQGTEQVPLVGDESLSACLNDAQLSQVADLLLRVEADYRFPQDIEWGFAEGRLWLLQSRPVTTIPPRWTRDESAERFPNVMTPLTWDFAEGGFHRSLTFSLRHMGYPAFAGKWFASFGHYIYGNQNAVAIFGGRAPFVFRTFDDLLPQVPRIREEFRWVQELPATWLRDLDSYLIRIGSLAQEPLETFDEARLWRHVCSIVEHGAEYFLPNIAISITQGVLCRILLRICQLSVGETEGRALCDALLSWCETKTSQINKELFELAQAVRALPDLEEILLKRDSRSILAKNLLSAFPEVQKRLGKFFEDHGHRETDIDAYQPPWAEAPWVVLDNLRLILQSPMKSVPAQTEREVKLAAQQAEMRLFTCVPEPLKFFVYENLRLARAYTSLDDLEHYQTTRLNRPLRRALRELGDRLVKRGVCEAPMDVFFAHVTQLDDAITCDSERGWRILREAMQLQKAAYLADALRKPEWVLGETPAEPPSGANITGVPGSPGSAEGAVYVVNSPDDFALFPREAMLVARTTSPAWTPLFYSACAIITESGGPLSHGAVTAREMRIPAVMSVRGCLTRLENGQRVRVDGTRGQVMILGS